MRRNWISAAAMTCLPLATVPGAAGATAGFRIYEAEDCQIRCEAGSENEGNLWASGGFVTPAFWGRAAGDSVRWAVDLNAPVEGLSLLVRYSYAADHYRGFSGTEYPERTLDLVVSGQHVGAMDFPDTGSWDLFETSAIALPPLEAGRHVFEIRSVAPHSVANLDCFILLRGPPDDLPRALRRTHIADSESGHHFIRATAGVQDRFRPSVVFEEFERIWEHFSTFIGWEPPTPVGIHVIEDARWPNPGSSSFQNQWGVFFPESTFLTDRGNWYHEMTHMFYVAHFPWWFDESSVNAVTTFAWAPALHPDHPQPPEGNPHYRHCVEVARELLADPSMTVDAAEPVQWAMCVKYGPEVFSRFFHLCRDAGERGEIDFTPGRHLTREELMHFMSQAAGEDVRPLYQRWRGYAGAG